MVADLSASSQAQTPFALSLSKGCSFPPARLTEEGLGFDKLSPNGCGLGDKIL